MTDVVGEMDDQPWGALYRGGIKSGFAYPVKATDVASALRAAGAEVGSLSFIVPRTPRRRESVLPGLLLLYAAWEERRDLPYQGCGGLLGIYAVPTARRSEVHVLLVGEVLPAAAHWLAEAARRSEVWRELRHERRISLDDSGLSVEDRDGGSWSSPRRM